MAKHFQYKIEVFFKEIILDGLLGKTKYYAIRIEFQEMGSSNVNLFIWIFNPANIENGAVCIRFTEKKITGQLPYHLNDPELFESANTYQVYSHSRTGGKCNKNQCCFSHDRRFTEQTIITKPFDSKLMKMMKMMKSKIS